MWGRLNFCDVARKIGIVIMGGQLHPKWLLTGLGTMLGNVIFWGRVQMLGVRCSSSKCTNIRQIVEGLAAPHWRSCLACSTYRNPECIHSTLTGSHRDGAPDSNWLQQGSCLGHGVCTQDLQALMHQIKYFDSIFSSFRASF